MGTHCSRKFFSSVALRTLGQVCSTESIVIGNSHIGVQYVNWSAAMPGGSLHLQRMNFMPGMHLLYTWHTCRISCNSYFHNKAISKLHSVLPKPSQETALGWVIWLSALLSFTQIDYTSTTNWISIIDQPFTKSADPFPGRQVRLKNLVGCISVCR